MTSSRTLFKQLLLILTSLGLVMTCAFLAPTAAEAKEGDALNVAFGGSLVGTDAYTTQGEEQMRGVLRAVDGGEEQVTGGVTLTGGNQGLRFDATSLELGESSGLIDQSFIAEVRFTPAEAEQAELATLFAAGGNFFARYQNSQLVYGFSSNASGTWANHTQAIDIPAVNEEHALSINYAVDDQGVVVVQVMLDGEEQPSVESDESSRMGENLQKSFGFGNDVHPQGLDRGFNGIISEIRVAASDGTTGPSLFELQPSTGAIEQFYTSWEGTIANDAYAPVDSDIMKGTVDVRGDATTSSGNLSLIDGDDAVVFTAEPNAFENLWASETGFVVETKFTLSGEQTNLATILSVGGNFFVRIQNDQLTYGFSGTPVDQDSWTDLKNTSTVPSNDQEHTLSVAWVPGDTAGGKMIVWLDRVELPAVEGSVYMRQSPQALGQVGFGNEVHQTALDRAINGTLSESRFALLEDGFKDTAFTLQTLAPIEDCEDGVDLDAIEAGNYQDVAVTDCPETIIAKAAALRPTEKQATWQEEGLTAFIHYGVNTFTGSEWGDGTEDPAIVDPTDNIDPDTWVRQLRDAGFRTVVITLKHHDGFMLWPTRYSDYDIASSPWKDGEGDIAKELSEAADKYGMKVGFYISPADSHAEDEGVFGNGSERKTRTIPTLVENDDRADNDSLPTFTYEATDYGEFFLNTLYEVLTQYGEVSEVWFDGAAGNTDAGEAFDYDAYYDLVHNLQPNANIAVGGRDIRWIGNETGEARENEWSTVGISDPDGEGKIDVVQPDGPFNQNLGSDDQLITNVRNGSANKLHWWPGEADMKLTGGWFAKSNDTPKNADTLMNHYLNTVGRNSVMLLNVPPTTTGLFADASVTAINEFAAERRQAFSLDHALGVPTTVGDQTVTTLTNGNVRDGFTLEADSQTPIVITLDEPKIVTRLGISEDIIDAGMTVKEFTVEAMVDGEWSSVATSGVIGAQRIVTFSEPVTSDQWRITVTDARAAYTISDINLWGQLSEDPGKLQDVYVDCSAVVAGDGSEDRPFNSLEQFRKAELAVGATLNFRSGTNCADADVTFWGYGTEEAPITVQAWGEGDVPTIDNAGIKARFVNYTAQGWLVEVADPEPTETQDPGQSPEPGESTDPGQSPEPGESTDPGQSPEPGESTDPGQSPEPGESTDPGQSPDPSESPDTGDSGTKGSGTEKSGTVKPSTTGRTGAAGEALKKTGVSGGLALVGVAALLAATGAGCLVVRARRRN